MEQLDLASPQAYAVRVEQTVEATSYRVGLLVLDWDHALIQIRVTDNLGAITNHVYKGATATSMMIALNKANLSSNSLHKRVLNQLVTDGKLPAGTVNGSPD